MTVAQDVLDAREHVRKLDPENTTSPWVVLGVDKNKLVLVGQGDDYENMLPLFKSDELMFGYAKVVVGDDMSKREKFVMICWSGGDVGLVKRGKMITLRAEVDEIFTQRAKVIEASDVAELTLETVKDLLIKSCGAAYGSSTS